MSDAEDSIEIILQRRHVRSRDVIETWGRWFRESKEHVSLASVAAPPAVRRRRMTEWAARILPAADRADYEELFRSELYDLAQSGSGRRAQFAYALRVLLRAPLLRRELRAPQPGLAGEVQ